MKRSDLAGVLRQPYTEQRGFGVEKVDKPGFANVWFVVPPKPPDAVVEKVDLQLVRDAILAVNERPSLATATEIQQTMAYLLVRREAVSSSRMEGTWSTVDEVLSPAIADVSRSATASVRGYANALTLGVEAVKSDGLAAMRPAFLCDLHKHVMQKDPGFAGVAGRLRTPGRPGDVVQIGSFGRKEDSIYNPAPPQQVRRCLDEVLEWMSDDSVLDRGDAGMGMALPIRMAVGHAHFEAVHPFSDGNGRIGRMLWALQMVAAGRLPLYLSSYVEAERTEYGEALQEAQKKLKYRRIIEFVCRAMIASSEEEADTQQALHDLPAEWRRRGKFRHGSSAARSLDLLLKMPLLTIKGLAAELGVSLQAASDGINRLVRAGVVRDRSGHGRRRIYAAEEVISVLARPFGADIDVVLEGARIVLQMPD
ncbi:MAG: Fic family protein [Gammaproteobacteria bacterium]|nr:MAG: Fic family protein [Gammaproteobacteria bacterium]